MLCTGRGGCDAGSLPGLEKCDLSLLETPKEARTSRVELNEGDVRGGRTGVAILGQAGGTEPRPGRR